ncbi:MAG: helix-turn-helix domain-containing protein [Chromatiales bacterium]|nr:helix-turn-helix domain-containing protein [Chromatiales bacterium]
MNAGERVTALVVALPETAGSALYGMVDVLLAAGTVWQQLARDGQPAQLFDVRIVSPEPGPFRCGNGIPVEPASGLADAPVSQLVILPELWLGPDESLHGRYPELMDWLRERYRRGTRLYSACSGAVVLAESGLLDDCPATSHWGYQDLFRRHYPRVRFDPLPNLVFADPAGRIVTAGGTTSWHDLALHIITHYGGTGEALRIAQVYLLKWHGEGQLPWTLLTRRQPHADAVVRRCEDWLREHFAEPEVLSRAIAHCGLPERTLKRRFRQATGTTLIGCVQNLRIEAAKRLLEAGELPVEGISAAVGYEDVSFFRRLFRRLTGLAPGQYRRMFERMPTASV